MLALGVWVWGVRAAGAVRNVAGRGERGSGGEGRQPPPYSRPTVPFSPPRAPYPPQKPPRMRAPTLALGRDGLAAGMLDQAAPAAAPSWRLSRCETSAASTPLRK